MIAIYNKIPTNGTTHTKSKCTLPPPPPINNEGNRNNNNKVIL